MPSSLALVTGAPPARGEVKSAKRNKMMVWAQAPHLITRRHAAAAAAACAATRQPARQAVQRAEARPQRLPGRHGAAARGAAQAHQRRVAFLVGGVRARRAPAKIIGFVESRSVQQCRMCSCAVHVWLP